MGEQNHFYFPEEVDVKYFPNDAMVVTPGYQMNHGHAMDRFSNASSESQPSRSSEHCFSPIPPSPLDDMSYQPDYQSTYSLPSHSYNSSIGNFQQTDNVRNTPTSLEWGIRGADLVKLYKFIVPKGKSPYFELLGKWTPTYETPILVHLDEPTPGSYRKNQFPCQYPGGCNGKTNVFGRPADLERHYKNVHASEKDSFPCDYRKCARKLEPFTRKDHYRDHLRDYHKEHIGAAKGEKSSREKNSQKWLKDQRKWLDERIIDPRNWRCARCLVRNPITSYAQQPWECSNCKNTCEEDCLKERLKRASGRQPPEDPTEVTMVDASPYVAPYPACGTCNGSTWASDGYGAFVSCPVCQTPAAPYSYEQMF